MKFFIKGFRMDRSPDDIADRVTGGAAGQLFLANEARRLMDPYVPADKIILASNVRCYNDGSGAVVHYMSPYAHYQYEGVVYADPKTGRAGIWIEGVGWRSRRGVAKKPTNRTLTYSRFRHQKATDHWDQAMLKDRKGDLEKAVQAYIDRR